MKTTKHQTTPESSRNKQRPRASKSLRSILTLWFLLFSIAPLAFVTGYSMVQFEHAIDDELYKRLRGNLREISVVFGDLESYLTTYGNIHATDPTLIKYLSNSNINEARQLLRGWMKNYSASALSLFDEEGRLVVSLTREQSGEPKSQTNLESGEVFLREALLKQMENVAQIKFRDFAKKSGLLELIVYTKVISGKGKTQGYLEEIISIDKSYLIGMQKRLNLEVFLLDKDTKVQVSTHDDFLLFPKNFFIEKMTEKSNTFFEVISRDTPYAVRIQPFRDGDNNVLLGLAISKRDVTEALRGINKALFTIVGIVVLLLFFTLVGASTYVLKPLYQLVEATQKIEIGKYGTQIPIESDTEIGLLTDSFNKMSLKVAEANSQLESKVRELEALNSDLQETQAQLVHSAKMVSLGQLVAGVAHELNNPIGFIYSNMTHLRDYSEKLIDLVEEAAKNPDAIELLKVGVEYDYIVQDMPKLIHSCEDGARRVRDIVTGLRNFSRLDETQIKDVNINESLENTLQLLAGEIKNRIRVHKSFGEIPMIKCYSSQINQVFMNILSNAAHAIDEDGDIWITTSTQGTWLEIKIKDSGSGIDTDTINKIFDPFFTTKPVGQGTGLGLSISYGIIKRHSGEIHVTSEMNNGTEFIILLPLNNENRIASA